MIKIRILHTEGCQSYLPALNTVENILNELSMKADINNVLITTTEEADKFKFIGSPTIQVNGIDIEPGARTVQMFGLT